MKEEEREIQFVNRNEVYSEKCWCGRYLYTKSRKDALCYGLAQGIRKSHNSLYICQICRFEVLTEVLSFICYINARLYTHCRCKTYDVLDMLEDPT